MTNDTMTIDERIQDLPQELQDTILNFILHDPLPSECTLEASPNLILRTADPNALASSVAVTRLVYGEKQKGRYLPPLGLQLNRDTRAKFAPIYYANRTFVADKRYQLLFWLESLTPEHRSMISTVVISWIFAKKRFGIWPHDEPTFRANLPTKDLRGVCGVHELLPSQEQLVYLVHVWNQDRSFRAECYRFDGTHHVWK